MITDRLLHIHVPRTGGDVLRYVLQNTDGLQIFSGDEKHLTYQQMRGRIDDPLPIITFIRSPWEYYLSQWGWLSAARAAGFPAPFRRYLDMIQAKSATHGLHTTLTRNWDLMGCNEADYIGRFERLRSEIVRILNEIIPDLITPQETGALLSRAPLFTPDTLPGWGPLAKGPSPYRSYYDSDLKKRVKRWDGELIERFGYMFGGGDNERTAGEPGRSGNGD